MTTTTDEPRPVRAPEPTQVSPAADPRSRPLAPIAWGTALVILGGMWFLEVAGVDMPWEALLPLAVVAVGIGLLLLARTGAHGGLIVLGAILTVLASFAAIVEGPVGFGMGERAYSPTSVSELERSYTLGAGQLVLDLRQLSIPDGVSVPVDVRLNMGEVVVRVPADVEVMVEARAGMGDVTVFGRSQSGIDARVVTTDGGPASRTIELDVSVAMGNIEVTR